MGTYRTLDRYDGEYYIDKETGERRKIKLGFGVCSKNGVAVLDDSNSLTLSKQGNLLPDLYDGSDEYVFAYGNDYRSAVKALYMITGKTPLIPRFALGNWWSRYHVYTDKEYLRLLNSFEEQEVPLTVATIDMDWHYSNKQEMEDLYHVTELGRFNKEYIGALNTTWTGYTWNKRLFPDYKAFLKKIKDKNLKITLNLHPADGIRYWETQYEDMCKALGQDPSEAKYVPFDIANTEFVNAYFDILHKPYEEDGVGFWWIDWQQGTNSKMQGLDPLWALNHYHYLDNAKNNSQPLILSRYSGIGAHRYPVGFSGDTFITWETLQYLPEFTATATNVGYTWWSHDIGGHMGGFKDDEMYLRHIQFGVFSPINRLHCSCAEIQTKEPWAFGNGAGALVKDWMRLRHRLIPYLYSSAYRTNSEGLGLIEPLYYEWDLPLAYKYKNEYLFGGQLLVIPVTSKAKADGFAHVKAWIPEGKWTDIFTGAKYNVSAGGKELTLYREMESIPVLIKEGGILPLSLDKGNSVNNPKNMEINVYSGNGSYELYEDGAVENKSGVHFTKFVSDFVALENQVKQTLTISTYGDSSVVPKTRKFAIRFKDIFDGAVSLFVNGKRLESEEILTNCTAIDVAIEPNNEYKIEVVYTPQTRTEELIEYAKKILICGRESTAKKADLWLQLIKIQGEEDYLKVIEETDLIKTSLKLRLKEIL
ncbi:MAG: alpha-xylosidase [Clostridia bacterium]|nr:alpha-xylosidase [Clostridia bacterium]